MEVSEIISLDNIDSFFSYATIKENDVRALANEILTSKILTEANKENRGNRKVFEALLQRIEDNKRLVSTYIHWFKQAHLPMGDEVKSIALITHPTWIPWSLKEHFSFKAQPADNIKKYVKRHHVVQHPMMNISEYEATMKFFKDFFADAASVKFLHDLQLEGIALQLICTAIRDQKAKIKYDDPTSMKNSI